MNASKPNEPPQDMRWDENDPVWRLLAQAPRPEPDAWFAVRTLARCRNEGLGEEERANSPAWLPRFGRMWRWALGGGLAVALAMALVAPQMTQVTQVQADTDAKQKNVQEAFEIMASIDTDSDSSSPPSTSWQDSSL